MHHPFLDLEFKDSPDFFYKILIVPQKNLNIVQVFTSAQQRRPTVRRFTGNRQHWLERSRRAYNAATRRRQKRTLFSKFLAKHRIIFTKFRDTPNPKVKRCELLFVKEASLSNPYPYQHNPHSHQKYGTGVRFERKEVIIFCQTQRI